MPGLSLLCFGPVTREARACPKGYQQTLLARGDKTTSVIAVLLHGRMTRIRDVPDARIAKNSLIKQVALPLLFSKWQSID
jgi:hypothetical protein